ncbi:MAG: hypothetical protein ABIS47_04550 [Acidimicrobiales bacterium]
MPDLAPTCVWRATTGLITLLDDAFGPPLDTYVNGSQVWLREDGPAGVVLEWRLHPVAGYARPHGVATEEVFELAAAAIATGQAGPAPLDQLWEGLEAFPAYGDEVEPAVLAAVCTAALGLAPDAAGLVDHDRLGDEWEQARGAISIIAGLLAELSRPAT